MSISYPPTLLNCHVQQVVALAGKLKGLSQRFERLLLCRLLGVPLLPLRWQLRLGVQRPPRPAPQITHLEQALLDVAPGEAPEGVPPSVQQQWRDDQELQEQPQEPVQASEGEQLQPGSQQDEMAQVTAPDAAVIRAHLHSRRDRDTTPGGRPVRLPWRNSTSLDVFTGSSCIHPTAIFLWHSQSFLYCVSSSKCP